MSRKNVFVSLAVFVILIVNWACGASAPNADNVAATAQAANNAANTQSVAVHETYVQPVMATELENVDDFLNGTDTPVPPTAQIAVPFTPTPAAILNSATACGKSDFKVGNREVSYIESDPTTMAVRYSLGGVEMDTVPNGYQGWVLADVFVTNTNGCITIGVSGT